MSKCPVLNKFFDHIDTRVNDYYLFSSIWYPVTIVTLYFVLVFKLLPKFMEKRKPYVLRKILIVYNIIQMILNAVIVIVGFRSFSVQKDWGCAKIDYTDSYDGRRELLGCYIYYLTKILDLLDTIFFVLKKNNRQVNYLHVYHHTTTLLGTWFVVRYTGGGHSLWVGFFNCCVHVLMYGYYLLTAYDRTYKEVIALKKFITISQIIQLTIILAFFINTLVRPCEYPKVSAYFIIASNLYLIYLFVQYYLKTYTKSSRRNGNEQINGNGRIKLNGKAH